MAWIISFLQTATDNTMENTSSSTLKRAIAMQPRGQLWFALEGICQDFQKYSGLGEKESLEVLIVVLTNMLAEQKTALEKLCSPKSPEPGV
jgi:hypothetical protein